MHITAPLPGQKEEGVKTLFSASTNDMKTLPSSERRLAMLERMARLHITDHELARDVHAVLAKVQGGIEIVIEHDHRPVAVIKTPESRGRNIGECIALAKEYEAKIG